MTWPGTKAAGPDLTAPGLCCIVGYGNRHRRDDGLGPRVVAMLDEALEVKERVRLLTRHQLEPDLVEELQKAGLIILVDASAEPLPGGWSWTEIDPQPGAWPHLTHTFGPGFLIGLVDLLYQRRPPAWLVSIQGDDFSFGEGLSPGAEGRASQVAAALAEFLGRKKYGHRSCYSHH